MKTALLFLSFLLLIGCNTQKTNDDPAKEIEHASFAENLKTDTSHAYFPGLESIIQQGNYPNIHSLLVAKEGVLIYEKYFEGEDQNYGRNIGIVVHSDTTLHDIRSVTKSIVSACMGIAISKGLIEGPEQLVSGFFPEFDTLFVDEKAGWTIHHFLTMTTGLNWNEDVPYDNPENDEIQMTYSEDPIHYTLSKALDTIPGTKWNYNGGATQVLSEIIERSSGKNIAEFASEYLFTPLSIEDFEWNRMSVWGPSDKFAAASGLRLRSRDLMKIGWLFRNKGKWEDKQVIAEEYVSDAFTPHISFPNPAVNADDMYGYQFWIWPETIKGNELRMIAAIGNGGQMIQWQPEEDIIIIATAGNYNRWNSENDSYALFVNEIYPVLIGNQD